MIIALLVWKLLMVLFRERLIKFVQWIMFKN